MYELSEMEFDFAITRYAEKNTMYSYFFLIHKGALTLYRIAQTERNCFRPVVCFFHAVVNVFVRLPITRKTHRNRRHTVSTLEMYRPGTE
jgi:hypothetical protein